jgi:sugar O-acyltransferase (sialic acid O-acetyltransferase NeuD family)
MNQPTDRPRHPVRVVIYGSRPDGHAKVLVDLLTDTPALVVVGLVDDFPEHRARRVRGLEVLGSGDDLVGLRESGIDGLLVGFGESAGRLEVLERGKAAGLLLPAFVHPSAHVSASVTLGEATQVLATAYVGPDAQLGQGVLVNTHAVVEHDVRLAPGSVVSPGAVVAGRARVGRSASVGAGATILPDRVVGDGAVVGAGAVITRDIAPGSVVVGVPGRPMEQSHAGAMRDP